MMMNPKNKIDIIGGLIVVSGLLKATFQMDYWILYHNVQFLVHIYKCVDVLSKLKSTREEEDQGKGGWTV